MYCVIGNHEYIAAGKGYFEEILPKCGYLSLRQ